MRVRDDDRPYSPSRSAVPIKARYADSYSAATRSSVYRSRTVRHPVAPSLDFKSLSVSTRVIASAVAATSPDGTNRALSSWVTIFGMPPTDEHTTATPARQASSRDTGNPSEE